MNVVYMLECEDGSFYIGWTNDLEKRMRAHFSGRGAKYTKAHRPVRLVYLERYEEKREAQRRVYEMQRRQRAAVGRTEEHEAPSPPEEKKEEIPSDSLLLLALLAVLISDRAEPAVIALLLYLLG